VSEPERRPLLVPGTVVFAVVGAVVVAAALSTINLWGESGERAMPGIPDPQVLRADDLRLAETPGDRTELVAFMDFECETCAALYPYLDQLRNKYAGEVTFAIRHFPEAGHASAVDAALAVEAAARQGKLEAMYRQLYDTQSEWGEAMESQREVFAGFARDLGLDMKRYRADLGDPRLRERVGFDRREGMALGVSAAPGLFLGGERFTLPESFPEVLEAIDAELEA